MPLLYGFPHIWHLNTKPPIMKLKLTLLTMCLLGVGIFSHAQSTKTTSKPTVEKGADAIPVTVVSHKKKQLPPPPKIERVKFKTSSNSHRETPPPPPPKQRVKFPKPIIASGEVVEVPKAAPPASPKVKFAKPKAIGEVKEVPAPPPPPKIKRPSPAPAKTDQENSPAPKTDKSPVDERG